MTGGHDLTQRGVFSQQPLAEILYPRFFAGELAGDRLCSLPLC